ncbi:MAG: HAD family hydrolase [Anaerolineaceae bacterium]|nr:HAD family hydrolase [Anaerolineaceae bacterium]
MVVFDVYKTLLAIESDENSLRTYKFLSTWLAYKGLVIKPKDLRKLYKNITKQAVLANTELYPDIDIKTVFKRILLSLVQTDENGNLENDAVEMGLLFRILTTKSLTIYPETVPILETLHRNNVRLAVLSNTQRLFTVPEFKRFGIEPYFDDMIFSSDVGACKPAAKIFETLLRRMKIHPQEAIFVGDNLFDDIFGAQSVGMKTVWLNRPEARAFPGGLEKPIPDQQIQDISCESLIEAIFSLI